MMEGEQILEGLAARYALDTTPDAWFEVARGARSARSAAELVADHESAELIERSTQLFAPDAVADERRLQRLLRDHLPSRWRHGRTTLALALALAAGLVLALSLPLSTDRGSTPELAEYSLELSRVARSDRASAPPIEQVAWFYADRGFRATLRPWDAVQTELRVAAHLCDADNVARRLPIRTEITAQGVITVHSEGPLDVGLWDLVFIIGTVGSLPELRSCDADDLPQARGSQILRTRIEVRPPP